MPSSLLCLELAYLSCLFVTPIHRSFPGSSPFDNGNQMESEASVQQLSNMKEQIENYREIISKQEQLLRVCILMFCDIFFISLLYIYMFLYNDFLMSEAIYAQACRKVKHLWLFLSTNTCYSISGYRALFIEQIEKKHLYMYTNRNILSYYDIFSILLIYLHHQLLMLWFFYWMFVNFL